MSMEFKAYLESIGDSIVCVADDDVVKVHVHTNDPGLGHSEGTDIRPVVQHEDRQYARRASGEADQGRREACAAQEAENRKRRKKPDEPRKADGIYRSLHR